MYDPSNMAGTHETIHQGSASRQDTKSEVRVLLMKLTSWREESLRHLSEILDSCTYSINKAIKDQVEEVVDLQTKLSVTTKWVQNYLEETLDKLNDEIRQISDKLSVAQPVMEPAESDSYDPLEMNEPELSDLDTNGQDGETVSLSANAQGIESGNFEEQKMDQEHLHSNFDELAGADVQHFEHIAKNRKDEPEDLIKVEVESPSDNIGNVVPKRKRGRPPTGTITGGTYCAAVGCRNNQRRDGTGRGISFHLFPKDEVRRKQWAEWINRRGADGKLWMPKPSSRLCSEHFYGGKKSDDPDSASYLPSMFSASQVPKPRQADLAREERRVRREEEQVTRRESEAPKRPDNENDLQVNHEEQGQARKIGQDAETVSKRTSADAQGIESGNFEEPKVGQQSEYPLNEQGHLYDSDFDALSGADTSNIELVAQDQGDWNKMEVEGAADNIGNEVPNRKRTSELRSDAALRIFAESGGSRSYKKTSPLWDHFTQKPDDINMVVCKHCEANHSANHSGMGYHLKTKHPEMWSGNPDNGTVTSENDFDDNGEESVLFMKYAFQQEFRCLGKK